eukprot:1865511-Pyramimonas_sp.AAC.1
MAHPIGDGFILGRRGRNPMAQAIGDGFILSRRGRNIWRIRSDTVLFSATGGGTHGVTDRT